MSFTLKDKKTGGTITFTRKSASPPFPGYKQPSKLNKLKLVVSKKRSKNA